MEVLHISNTSGSRKSAAEFFFKKGPTYSLGIKAFFLARSLPRLNIYIHIFSFGIQPDFHLRGGVNKKKKEEEREAFWERG